MNRRGIRFIKGHMGGNEIVLLYGHEIPKDRELEVSLSVLAPPYVRGHQAGLLTTLKAIVM